MELIYLYNQLNVSFLVAQNGTKFLKDACPLNIHSKKKRVLMLVQITWLKWAETTIFLNIFFVTYFHYVQST